MVYWLLKVVLFLAEYSELATIWAGITIWEYATKTRLSAETRWSLYAGAFAAISFWNWHKATARAEAAEAAARAAATKPETPPRTFAEDPESLMAQLRDPKTLTAMQVVPYYDKWIYISGRMEFAACGSATLLLERGQRVNLRFDAGQERRLRDVRRGQYMSAVCQIRPSYSHSRVAMENGEVVRVGPLPAILQRVS
jgi:hypothetical protein